MLVSTRVHEEQSISGPAGKRDIDEWSNMSEKGHGQNQPKGKSKGEGKGKINIQENGTTTRTRLDLQMKMDSGRWVILV